MATYLAKTNWTIHDDDFGAVTSYFVTPSTGVVTNLAGTTVTFNVTRSGDTPAETVFASTLAGVNGWSNNNGLFGDLNGQGVTFAQGATSSSTPVTVTLSGQSLSDAFANFGVIVQKTAGAINNFLAQTNFSLKPQVAFAASIPEGPQQGIDWRGNQLSSESIAAAHDKYLQEYIANTSFVIRYIGVSDGYLRADEANSYRDAHLKIVSVFEKAEMAETNPNWETYFTGTAEDGHSTQGYFDGMRAISAAHLAGQTTGAIYFGIDLDPRGGSLSETEALARIDSYFREIRKAFNDYLNAHPEDNYEIGVYGAGDTCRSILGDAAVDAKFTWLAGSPLWTDLSPDPRSTPVGHTTFTDWTIKQYDNKLTKVGSTIVDLDQTKGDSFGQWVPGDKPISIDSSQTDTAVGPGPQGTLSIIGKIGQATHVALTALGDQLVILNADTGKTVVQAVQFGKMVFNDISSLVIGALNGTSILHHTVYFNGADGGDNLDASASDTSVVATGGNGNDTLIGGLADDTFTGGPGNDTIDGGAGIDTVVYSSATQGIVVNLSLAQNQATGPEIGTDQITNIENVIGGSGDDRITGGIGANLIDGGAGADVMIGGLGDDAYVVDNVGDQVMENPGEGRDTIYTTVNYTTPGNVEVLTAQGAADLQINGNGLANTIFGNSGSNIIDGGGGADLMIGGLGDDAYVVDNVGDQVVENPGEGRDAVYTTVNYTLSSNVEVLIAQGGADLQINGNGLANTVFGNSGSNVIDGGAGADILIGGLGDDSYVVDNVADVVTENPGEGRDAVYTTVNYTLSSNVEVMIAQGAADLQINGNSLANTIFGNSGSNVIDGGAGADLMLGGIGDDFIRRRQRRRPGGREPRRRPRRRLHHRQLYFVEQCRGNDRAR